MTLYGRVDELWSITSARWHLLSGKRKCRRDESVIDPYFASVTKRRYISVAVAVVVAVAIAVAVAVYVTVAVGGISMSIRLFASYQPIFFKKISVFEILLT